MTLSDHQSYSPTASILKCDFCMEVQQLMRFLLT